LALRGKFYRHGRPPAGYQNKPYPFAQVRVFLERERERERERESESERASEVERCVFRVEGWTTNLICKVNLKDDG